MIGILIGIHVFLVIILIAVILVQQPRGRGLGAFFGGAHDLLGVRGAPTFFQKMTWGISATIGVIAILIAILSKISLPESKKVISRQDVFQIVPLFSEEIQKEESPSIIPLEQDIEKTKEK